MDEQLTRQKISEAWRQHREGQHGAAIDGFQAVLDEEPAQVDALYGIGLAFRADGQAKRAIDSFSSAQEALAAAEKERVAGKAERQDADTPLTINDPIAGDDDRFLILSRMINQRLAELGAASA